MKYSNIKQAVFLDRPNRFIAHAEVNGHVETVHVKNTGRCRELLIPGAEIWLTSPGTPGRKTEYDLIAVREIERRPFQHRQSGTEYRCKGMARFTGF